MGKVPSKEELRGGEGEGAGVGRVGGGCGKEVGWVGRDRSFWGDTRICLH
jgi:hypothetical protein